MTSTAIYATLAEVKAQPDITGTSNDIVLTALLDVASRLVDAYCNRIDDGFVAGGVSTERLFVGIGKTYCYIDEALSVDEVEIRYGVNEEWEPLALGTWAPFTGDGLRPDFNHAPYHGIALTGASSQVIPDGRVGNNYSDISYGLTSANFPPVPTLRVTAKWGYAATVPSVVKQATIIIATRMFKRGQSAWTDATANADLGQMVYTKEVDPDVKALLVLSRMTRPLYG